MQAESEAREEREGREDAEDALDAAVERLRAAEAQVTGVCLSALLRIEALTSEPLDIPFG